MQKGIGFANSIMGRQYLLMNDYEAAKKYQKLALNKFTELDFDFGKVVAYERLGALFMTKNEYLKAISFYYQALSLNQKLKLQHETGVSLYHIGLTKLYLSDYEDAVNYILQSLKIWDKLNETANIWNCNELIGNIYIKTGNYDKALYYHRIALLLSQQNIIKYRIINKKITHDYLLGIAYFYNNIAKVYLNLNEYDSAYLMINRATETFKKFQNKSSYSEAMYGLGILNSELKKYNRAKENYIEGLKTAKQIGDKYDIEKGYKHLSELYSDIHNYKSALKYHSLYTHTKDSIFNHETKNKIAELQIKYGVDKKEQKIAHQKTVIKQK